MSGIVGLSTRRLIVNIFECAFISLGRRRESITSVGLVCRFTWLLVLAVLVAGAAPRTDAQITTLISDGSNLRFVYSDFDGDLRPDLAVVQSGRSDLSFTDYWVQFQLTTARPQAIRVVAPTGGLQIATWDVNGDHVPDLVLTTTWDNHAVAVLLNEGHGSFSRLDPSAYPAAFRASKASWSYSAHLDQVLVGFLSLSRTGASPMGARPPYYLDSSVRAARRSDHGSLLNPELVSHLGRSPPSNCLIFRI
jgi:hypothetical protein